MKPGALFSGLTLALSSLILVSCSTPRGQPNSMTAQGQSLDPNSASLPRQGYHLDLEPGGPPRLFVYTDTAGG